MTTHRTTFTIHIAFTDANTINKLADVQLAFKGGPLDGVTLSGFSVWQNKSGNGENVSFPARPYTTPKGEKKTFSYIHGESAGMSQLRTVILEAYRAAKRDRDAQHA